MSIRFKFRSSVNFDTVVIDGNRDSISVRELRARILRGTTSQQQQGFDLVFSDAVTGREYVGDDCHIPTGSSVIVKRVPGGTLPSAAPPVQPVKTLSIHPTINIDPASGQMQRKTDEEMKWKISSDFLAQSASLPPELKCTLCSTFFNKAVMIPCCQHSFCEKCIQRELTEKGRCPKCLSGKCKVGNLLPNVALDKAIKHFLESQMLDGCLENDLEKYAPDGESVIQGKHTLNDIGVVQRNIESAQSSSGTGKGSNQILINASITHHGLRMSFEDSANGERDSQGENQPDIPPDYVGDEADTNTKGYNQNWNGNFLVHGQRKGIRTCYRCGSPSHLMRDCSNISNLRNGAFHGGFAGYAPPYWGASSYGPYPNIYNTPNMLSFAPPMVPYPVSFLPPIPGGNMQVGVMGPPLHSDYFRLQHCKERINSNENQERRKFAGEEEDKYEPRFSSRSEERSRRKREHEEVYVDSARDKKRPRRSSSDRHGHHHEHRYESDSRNRDVRGSDKRHYPRDENHDYRSWAVHRWEEGDSRSKYRNKK